MNRESIITYLKFNKKLGVAFVFMPKEVQKWAKDNSKELCIYTKLLGTSEYGWVQDGNDKPITNEGIYALPDDFEPEGYWVEYDVQNGNFYDEQRGVFFAWYDWPRFMSDNPGFTAFGGWQYSSFWHMTPQLSINGDLRDEETYINDEAKPAIPKKIRFWKEDKK